MNILLSNIAFKIGMVLIIFSSSLGIGILKILFMSDVIPRVYSLLLGGIGSILIAPDIYYTAKKKERQYGSMTINDRKYYVYPLVIGMFCITMFFYIQLFIY